MNTSATLAVAREIATRHGHSLGPWRELKLHVYESACARCDHVFEVDWRTWNLLDAQAKALATQCDSGATYKRVRELFPEGVRAIPDTPEAALVELVRTYDVARSGCYDRDIPGVLDSFQASRRGGIEAVARLVLSDPEGWREALGLDHLFLASDALSPDTRCGGCGVRLADVSDSDICPGVPA